MWRYFMILTYSQDRTKDCGIINCVDTLWYLRIARTGPKTVVSSTVEILYIMILTYCQNRTKDCGIINCGDTLWYLRIARTGPKTVHSSIINCGDTLWYLRIARTGPKTVVSSTVEILYDTHVLPGQDQRLWYHQLWRYFMILTYCQDRTKDCGVINCGDTLWYLRIARTGPKTVVSSNV
jgi:hypothetical protein